MQNLSIAVFIGFISMTDAVKIAKDAEVPKEKTEEEYRYAQFGKGMPSFWNDFQSDPFFADTWRFSGNTEHFVQMTNNTAYTNDAPADYHFPTGTEQWEPDALIQLEQRQNVIESYGMTAAPADDSMISLEWNNKPWKQEGYAWDQSTVNKHYQVADSHSYISPYDQRDHSWNDAQYNQSDEVKYFDNTKTLASDYLENTLTTAEYHLREGRAGVRAEDEV